MTTILGGYWVEGNCLEVYGYPHFISGFCLTGLGVGDGWCIACPQGFGLKIGIHPRFIKEDFISPFLESSIFALYLFGLKTVREETKRMNKYKRGLQLKLPFGALVAGAKSVVKKLRKQVLQSLTFCIKEKKSYVVALWHPLFFSLFRPAIRVRFYEWSNYLDPFKYSPSILLDDKFYLELSINLWIMQPPLFERLKSYFSVKSVKTFVDTLIDWDMHAREENRKYKKEETGLDLTSYFLDYLIFLLRLEVSNSQVQYHLNQESFRLELERFIKELLIKEFKMYIDYSFFVSFYENLITLKEKVKSELLSESDHQIQA